MAGVHGLAKMTKTVEFDAAALQALKDKKGSDSGKVINLIKSLTKSATDRGAKEPYLISIAERAESVMADLEGAFVGRQSPREAKASALTKNDAQMGVMLDKRLGNIFRRPFA